MSGASAGGAKPGEPAALVALQEAIYASSNPVRRYLHHQRLGWVRAAIAECGARTRGIGTALEIGPGSGIYVPALLAAHAGVTVTDIEAQHLAHVQSKYGHEANLRVTADNITHSALPAAHFDTILCTEVIEHIADTAPVLAALLRLLKPGGRLILTTPQKYSTLELCCRIAFLPGIIDLVRRIYREPILETGHINLMTRAQVAAALDTAGFAVERSAVMGMYVPLLSEFGGQAAARLAQWLEGVLRGGPLQGLLWTQCVVARQKAQP